MIIDAHAHLIRNFTGSVGNGESYDLRNGEIQFLDGSISRIIPVNCTAMEALPPTP